MYYTIMYGDCQLLTVNFDLNHLIPIKIRYNILFLYHSHQYFLFSKCLLIYAVEQNIKYFCEINKAHENISVDISTSFWSLNKVFIPNDASRVPIPCLNEMNDKIKLCKGFAKDVFQHPYFRISIILYWSYFWRSSEK